MRFENCYAPDAPCLPSRAALFLGRFGIHTGVVGHGGTAADLRLEGARAAFGSRATEASWMDMLARGGPQDGLDQPLCRAALGLVVLPGFSEMHNPGKCGQERADEVAPLALDWIARHGQDDNWFLQINMWDPHTPYRTPLEYGNPFEGEPLPAWITAEKIAADYAAYGPHSAQDPASFGPNNVAEWPRLPADIATLDDYRQWIDGYDTGIRYMDDHIGLILAALRAQGVLDDCVSDRLLRPRRKPGRAERVWRPSDGRSHHLPHSADHPLARAGCRARGGRPAL